MRRLTVVEYGYDQRIYNLIRLYSSRTKARLDAIAYAYNHLNETHRLPHHRIIDEIKPILTARAFPYRWVCPICPGEVILKDYPQED